MTYTSSWYHGGSGIIQYQPYGTKYTIRQLLEYSLKYSDNIAYFMLVNLFGKQGFNEMVKEWGYDIALPTGASFTNVNAKFMCTSMLKMHEYKDDGESTFTDEQRKNADINGDGLTDAIDATFVLSYYAHVSAGGTENFMDFINS